MVLVTLLYVIFLHTVMDFCFQTESQAKTKSKDFLALCRHCLVYSSGMFAGVLIIANFWLALQFAVITMIFHTITDFISSKLTSRKYSKGEIYGPFGFFAIVGFDQFAHIAQITITLVCLGIIGL